MCAVQACKRHHHLCGLHLRAQFLALALRSGIDGTLFRAAAIAIIEVAGTLEEFVDAQVVVAQLPCVGGVYPYRISLRHAFKCTVPPGTCIICPGSALRLLLYNIRYATGAGPAFHLPVPGAGYLRSSRSGLEQITRFIRQENPDLVGLIEVDTGSIRTRMVNQAEYIADFPGPLHGLRVQVRLRFGQSPGADTAQAVQRAAGGAQRHG